MFVNDDDTKSIVMIGEIGGSAEEEGAKFLKDSGSKSPWLASSLVLLRLLANAWGRRRDYLWWQRHSGSKIDAMKSAGIHVSASPATLGETMLAALKR